MDNSSTPPPGAKYETTSTTSAVDEVAPKIEPEIIDNSVSNEISPPSEKKLDSINSGISSNINNNFSGSESMKKGSVSSHYRLRKRRSAYLQSDSSSDREPELDVQFNEVNSTGSSYTGCENRLSTNSFHHSNSMILDDNSALVSNDANFHNDVSHPRVDSLTNRPFRSDIDLSTVVLVDGCNSTSNNNPTFPYNNNNNNNNNNSYSLDPNAYEVDGGGSNGNSNNNGTMLCDFAEKHPNEQPKPVEYPSILRLFALQYTIFPGRVIDNRFTPVSYEQSDNVKPDYKLISPFVYYYHEFTSFELSFYSQMLILFLHSKICRVPQVCMNRLCVGYQAIVLHLKQCFLYKCKNVYCFSSRLVLHHIVTCSKPQCQFCPKLPIGTVEYCKSFLYSQEQSSIKLVAILKNAFSAPCISIRNDDFNVSSARKILNHILNDYLCIDKNSYAEQNNKVLASVDRSKILNDIISNVNKKKLDVINNNGNLLLECTNFENTLYRHSHNKDIYLQSISNIGLMFQFFSQIMIKTKISPLEELKQTMSQTCVIGLSTRFIGYQTNPSAFDQLHNRESLLTHNGNNTNNGNVRDLSYGYENMFKFTPTQIFPPKKICDIFLPLLQEIFNSPDGIPFHAPVDPVYFMIYDYYDLITHPMDLYTIITRLKERFYVDPWEVIHDIWQTFKNAWFYNRRTTRVFKIATRLKDMFLEKVDPIIKTLKLCCSHRRVLTPQPLFCMGKDYCVIHREAIYYVYQNYYIYCERCFNSISGDTITIAIDEEEEDTITNESTVKIESQQPAETSNTPQEINETKISTSSASGSTSKTKAVEKTAFVRETNSKVFMENFVECRKCNRRAHQICKQHTAEIDGIYYYCDECLEKIPPLPKYNRYTSDRLKETHLSSFIEQRLNEMLIKKLGQQIQPVRIRQVYNNLKKLKTSDVINEYFVDKYPPEFVYHSKALFAFQKLNDNSEICFFGMHVQEFDSDSPEPNRGRAYLSYLDSVHFFQPKHLKTEVYFTILTAYFEFVRRRGFSYVHLWACPPCEGDDYIFHCHPAEQRVPKHKRLVDWYRKLLDECVKLKIFTKIKDLHKYIVSEKKSQLTLIPYFEGDYWPNAFEDIINEVKAEKNPDGTVNATVNTAAASLRRGRAMLMQNYDNEDTEEETAHTDDVIAMTAHDDDSNISTTADNVGNSDGSSLVNHNKPSKSTKKKRSSKSSQRQKRSKSIQQKKRAETAVPEFLTVEQRLFNLLERFKDVFFVCRLNNNNCGGGNNYSNSGVIVQKEPDPQIQSELTDGRSGFLQLCRERKWEFSTLLRTKFTTLGFLVELHIQFGDRFIFTCNNCKCHLFNKYHCTVCPDFDLCYKCFYVYGHEHQMVEVDGANNPTAINLVNFNHANLLSPQTMKQQQLHQEYQSRLNVATSSNTAGCVTNNNNNNNNPPLNLSTNIGHSMASKPLSTNNHPNVDAISQQTNLEVAQELLDIMLHCSTCPVESIYEQCPTNEKCQRMRIAINHCSGCNYPDRFKCPVCYSLMTLCIPHARVCRTSNCRVVFCKQIRERLCYQPHDVANRSSYQTTNRITSTMDTQRCVPAMQKPNYIRPISISTTTNTSNATMNDNTSSSGNNYHQNYSTTTQTNISTPPAVVNVDISNIANRNLFVAQKDPSLFQPSSNLHYRSNITSTFPNNPTLKSTSSVNSHHNDRHPTAMKLDDRRVPSVKFTLNQNGPMSTLIHNPTINPSSNHSFMGNQSQQLQQPRVTMPSSTLERSDAGITYNPLKNVLLAGPPVYGNENGSGVASLAANANASVNLPSSPVVIKTNPSNIVYLKEVPMLIDPRCNPSIPTQDILAHNLSRIRHLLDSNEMREKNIIPITNYVKLFPYVMCHLSDHHQHLVVSYLKNQKCAVKLDEKEESLILFLHRIQAARIIQKIQRQHHFYKNNVDSISQLAQQQNNNSLKSIWTMPKQQIVDFINSFEIVGDPPFQESLVPSTENTKEAENSLFHPNNLILNAPRISGRLPNGNNLVSGTVAPNNTTTNGQSNQSTLCYMSSDPNDNNVNSNLARYVKTLLLNNCKIVPTVTNPPSTTVPNTVAKSNDNTGNGCLSQRNIQNDTVKNGRGGLRENISFVSDGRLANVKSKDNSTTANELDVKSPMKFHSAKETSLPHLAMFSCDTQKTIRPDSFVTSTDHSSSSLTY